jgi:hypothetical protein
MSDDLSAEVTMSINGEEAKRAISALQMLYDSIVEQSESEAFEDAVEALQDEANRTKVLLDKIQAAS